MYKSRLSRMQIYLKKTNSPHSRLTSARYRQTYVCNMKRHWTNHITDTRLLLKQYTLAILGVPGSRLIQPFWSGHMLTVVPQGSVVFWMWDAVQSEMPFLSMELRNHRKIYSQDPLRMTLILWSQKTIYLIPIHQLLMT
jgi:hypothetical protein